MTAIDFDAAFQALTGNPPFPWQRTLYNEWFSQGKVPPSCNLPTGLGKTSVIAVWLTALANGHAVPRRLVYVVNRRTVVDQTTDEVVKYRWRLDGEPEKPEHAAVLKQLAEQLGGLGADPQGKPLAISTLRGQFADNREWSADPSRPAVICGTVDMIGSRLLFSGYGCGFKTRPLHAGFLGQDALIVHDEAHLEPAFQKLLLAIECEQAGGRMNEKGECEKCEKKRDFRPLKVMELTATSRAGGEKPFTLGDDDYKNGTVQQRINATKKLHLHENKDEKKLAEEIADLASKYKDSGRAILVFVRRVDDVAKIVKKLPEERTRQLTGTLRGLERDALVEDAIFKRFLPKAEKKDETVYLVCTSAGEVGVNISADHLVCDLSTFESMAQRFGRVNRFGERDDTEIHVLHPKEFETKDKPVEAARERTLALLRELNGDVSPAALGKLDAEKRKEAFTPPPTILPTSDILFDAWALTTIRDRLPGRPHVEPYLHGVAEWQPPETHVAWRQEVERITDDLLAEYPPKDLLEDYPLKPHELLRDNSSRVYDRLKRLDAKPETPVWLVSDDGSVKPITLRDLIDSGKEGIERKTVLLPPSAGGLANGFLTSDSDDADDVADEWYADTAKTLHRRVRVWGDDDDFDEKTEGMRWVCTITFAPPEDDEDTEGKTWHWYERPQGGDSEGSKSNKQPVSWQTHTDDVVGNTKAIIGKLLPEFAELFRLAAECHDLGKKRKMFQTVLGNGKYPAVLLAKSGKKGGRIKERYRHEFGSLLDIQSREEFTKLPPDDQMLVLHLIAAHHGRGRPHFPADEAFDPEPNGRDASEVARAVPQRFARLQRKYGRWGLAYLESLLRAADYAASASPSKFEPEDE